MWVLMEDIWMLASAPTIYLLQYYPSCKYGKLRCILMRE